jgi:hypothetical protein
MFHLWSTGTCGSKLHIAFKLLRDGPTSGGSSDHPIVSTYLTDINHPFVDCVIDSVRVRALVDTGSMTSFVQRVIDFMYNVLSTLMIVC